MNMPRLRLVSALKGLIGLGFLGYVTARIFTLDITGDEFPYPFPLSDIFSLKNIEEQLQPLIYMLSTISKSIFSWDVVTEVRLPCIPIFVFYALAAARLTRRIRPAWLELLAFTAFLTNPFALDFFSIQRGYGLAMLFILSSAVFAVEMITGPAEKRANRAAWAVWLGSFAVVGNLASLHYYLSICAFLVLATIDWGLIRREWQRPSTWWTIVRTVWAKNLVVFANAAILGVFWLPRIILLVKGKELYSGGETGFIHDTVGSLVAGSMYDIAAPAFHDIRAPNGITLALAAGLTLASLFVSVHAMWRRRSSPAFMATAVVSALLLLMVGSINAQHYLAGVRFIWERGALTLLPLFVAQIVLYAHALTPPIARAPVVAFLAAYVLLFPLNANMTHTWGWRQMSQTRKLLRELTTLHNDLKRPIIVGVSDATKPKIDYYKEQMRIDWLQWYPIDMYFRFNGQYQIHPETDFFYIWNQHGFPEGLKGLPLEPVPGADFSGASSGLYQIRDRAALRAMVGQPDSGPAVAP
jgi:hypothetical protein